MKNKKLWIFLTIVVCVLMLNHIFGWSTYLGDKDNLIALQKQLEEQKLFMIGIYMAVTIVGCVILAIPGVTFAIVAGLLFGPILGTLVCSIATTIGAILAFIAGRFFLQDSIRPVIMKNKYLKKWLFDEAGKNEIFVLMITRLIPIFPYNLQNFAYGITDIKFSTYAIYSFLFMLPGTAMYTIGTAGITAEENQFFYISFAVVLAIVVMLFGTFLKKRYIKEEEEKEQ